MKQIQKGAKDRCLFSELIKGSIKGVTTLEERFKCLKYTGNTVNIEKPATVEEITDLFQTALLSLDGDFSLPDGDILQMKVEPSKAVKKFIDHHCHESHYRFQVCFTARQGWGDWSLVMPEEPPPGQYYKNDRRDHQFQCDSW